jgi:O-antigen ligase
VALATGTLILTRSRAAYLGLIAVFGVMFLGSVFCRAVRRDRRLLLRFGLMLLIAGVGVAGALLLPNALEWRSDSPYLETARGVVNYREGSGRGRLIQYGNSLRILLHDPVFGAGPGNWAVDYPEHAEADDPSLDRSEPGTTSNPWPSSDWIAFLSERGLLGAGLLALAVIGLGVASWRRMRTARDSEEGLCAVACLAVIAGTATVGAFDAVLLLAWPTLLVWAAFGALWTPETGRPAAVAPAARVGVVAVLALASLAGAVRSAGMLGAMAIYASEPGRSGIETAARLDPGNFRVRMAAARSYGRREEGRCRHALAAHGLFPSARSAERLASPCD